MRTAVDLHGRHLLTLDEFTAEETSYLIDLAADLKVAKQEGMEEQLLKGKEIVVILEREFVRSCCAIEVAAHDQGAQVTFIGPSGDGLGDEEAVKDTARILGRMYDAIEYRGQRKSVADELAEWSGVTVYYGLTDECHPAQVLADFLTFDERLDKPLDEVAFCFLGDARCGLAGTYLVSGAKLGTDVRIASPPTRWPAQDIIERASRMAKLSGGRVTVTDDVEVAVLGADALLTAAWASADDPADVWAERIRLLQPYQVNARTMALTGNPHVKFMHCLPAYHGGGTRVGRALCETYGVDALEVTDEVLESPASLVFDEAENRMHATKAVLVATLGD